MICNDCYLWESHVFAILFHSLAFPFDDYFSKFNSQLTMFNCCLKFKEK